LLLKKKIFAFFLCLIMLMSLSQVVFASSARIAYFDLEQATPTFNAENVPIDQVIKLKFTREIKRLEGKIKLASYTKGEVPVIEEINGDTLTLKPIGNLEYNTRYYIELQPNSVENGEDDAPNYFKGRTHVINFHTVRAEVQPVGQTKVMSTLNQQPVSTQAATVAQQTTQQVTQPVETVLIEKGKPLSLKINGQPATYAVWVSNPKIAHAQVQNGHLVINGIADGTVQVAIRNTLNNKKVVMNVKVVSSILNL
jgi:hypothetical protein